MRLSIRGRLALSYGAVMVLVLAVVAVAVSVVHERLGMARIDDELNGYMRALAGVVDDEIDEGLDLPAAASHAMAELELPTAGIAILDAQGTLLGRRTSAAPNLRPETLAAAPLDGAAVTVHDVRLRASTRTYNGQIYRAVAWIPRAPFERERATVQNTIRASIPIALVVAVAGGWLLGRRALKPLTTMAARADQIDDRRLDERLPLPNTNDELARLGTAFNALLDRLSSAVQAQRRFMADASHQLRTPVSVARTTAQVTLGGETRTEAEYRESLDIIATQTQRLTKMVDDMFTLALADIEARPLEIAEIYLDEIVRDCCRAGQILAAARGIGIEADVPADVGGRGDEELLRQLLMNLIENAIRHTPAGGTVRVTLRDDAVRSEIVVEDTGSGIPEPDRDRIFERFVRLAPAGSEGGAGLGLPIARWIAEQHGGSLQVGAGVRGGSRFVLVLPKDATSSVRPAPLSPAPV